MSALIHPLNKTPSPKSPQDYRPISILPALSKAFERLVIAKYLVVQCMSRWVGYYHFTCMGRQVIPFHRTYMYHYLYVLMVYKSKLELKLRLYDDGDNDDEETHLLNL